MAASRKNFQDCRAFTAKRSSDSIIHACQFDRVGGELNVLDAFAGQGLLADALANYLEAKCVRYRLTVADVNKDHLLCVSNKYSKLNVNHCANVIGGRYNVITMRYGLHDLSYTDKVRAIQNLSNSVKESGCIVISDIMPDLESRKWFEPHHQEKERLTDGPNSDVCLSSVEDYCSLLEDAGLEVEIVDCFYQEIFMREWVKTHGASDDVVAQLEMLTLDAPEAIKKRFFVFDHPTEGARIYFPIVTIRGRNG